jgi:hypothetical protein
MKSWRWSSARMRMTLRGATAWVSVGWAAKARARRARNRVRKFHARGAAVRIAGGGEIEGAGEGEIEGGGGEGGRVFCGGMVRVDDLIG